MFLRDSSVDSKIVGRRAASTLVIATTNVGKISEFRALLDVLLDLTCIRLVTPDDLGIAMPSVEESGTTFVENARIKAIAYAAATGFPSLADDSGLCVDALGGAPGLYSARWAGPEASDQDRTAFLLHRLHDVPAGSRTAQFVCAAAVASPDGTVDTAEGICNGTIALTPRGIDGFGYDPIFVLHDLGGHTMAELPAAQKNLISHRSLALTALLPKIIALGFPLR